MEPNIKMIVTDLDNTLLRRDETISDCTREVFRRLHERGLIIAFATARSLEASQEYRDMLSPDGDIVTGGCLVYSGARLLRSHYLPKQQGQALLAELDAHAAIKRVSARSMNASYSNVPMEGRICVDFQWPFPDKLLHCSCRTDDDALMKWVASRYPEFSFLHVSGSDLYDINPKDATKLNGVKTLAAHFNIPLAEVVAFGDDHSDAEMLREAGIGVAVANAIPEVKAAANHLCADCDADGVAKWLAEYLQNSRLL